MHQIQKPSQQENQTFNQFNQHHQPSLINQIKIDNDSNSFSIPGSEQFTSNPLLNIKPINELMSVKSHHNRNFNENFRPNDPSFLANGAYNTNSSNSAPSQITKEIKFEEPRVNKEPIDYNESILLNKHFNNGNIRNLPGNYNSNTPNRNSGWRENASNRDTNNRNFDKNSSYSNNSGYRENYNRSNQGNQSRDFRTNYNAYSRRPYSPDRALKNETIKNTNENINTNGDKKASLEHTTSKKELSNGEEVGICKKPLENSKTNSSPTKKEASNGEEISLEDSKSESSTKKEASTAEESKKSDALSSVEIKSETLDSKSSEAIENGQ